MSMNRKSKDNQKYMECIDRIDNNTKSEDYYKRRWKLNPKCKYVEVVKAIEREKRLNGETE